MQMVSKTELKGLQEWSWAALFKLQLRDSEPLIADQHRGELLPLEKVCIQSPLKSHLLACMQGASLLRWIFTPWRG